MFVQVKLCHIFTRNIFQKYGVITSVSVVKDKHDSFRSFGLISFNRPEDAEKAVQALNGIDIDGKSQFCMNLARFQRF